MRLSIRILVACGVGALALTAGCGRKVGNTLGIPNQPPAVRLTGSPPRTEGATQIARQLSWVGSDPDGRVDHYVVALDPRSVDKVDESWTAVTETQRTIHMRRALPTPLNPTGQAHREPTIFAVSAVDDQGAVSTSAWQAMWGENLAPVVRIILPYPTHLAVTSVPSQIRISWVGNDPDGAIPNRLAKFKFKLFAQGNSEFPIELAILDPDSLRRFYAPGFAGWDSLPGDSSAHTYTNLVPFQTYLFVVTGFDANGDYDPIFSLDKNMLRMRVLAPGTGGPRITFHGDYFRLTSVNGEPLSIDADSRKPLTVNWSAVSALNGGDLSFRWAVDIADPNDGTPRRNAKDLAHWSEWGEYNTSATIPPPRDGVLVRRLYVEAQDQSGLMTLTSLRIQYYRPTFARDLLIVDDTRLVPDQIVNGTLRPPTGPWPTAAELDSFLFARGGVPWRGYTAGTLSRPGLFAGYGFDTLGTNSGNYNSISADLLSQYRHVIWYVDAKSAGIRGEAGGQPVTALRWMSAGRVNALAAYVQAGGQLWLLGGGAGLASTIEWRARGNTTNTFSSARGELVPGQFMYEYPHWRSEFTYDLLTASVVRATPGASGGRWDFSRFPMSLDGRTPATDPLPPMRSGSAAFYARSGTAEYLTQPNTILENHNDASRRGSPLDTLYSLGSGSGFPIMTFYHGRESGAVLFSGFDIWSFRRDQGAQLVDAVLQGIWGLPRVSGTPTSAQSEEAVVQRSGH